MLSHLGYGDLNYDALWKWCAILAARDSLNVLLHAGCSIDIGGGHSPVHHWCSCSERITNVDKDFNDTWFESKNRMYVKAPKTPSHKAHIRYVEDTFENFSNFLLPNTIDRCYDGCSIIHFQKTNKLGRHNDGVAQTADAVFRILKPGGFFIMASDTCAPDAVSTNPEWITFQQIDEAVTASGLVQHGPVNLNTDDLYMYPANDGTLLTISLHTYRKPL